MQNQRDVGYHLINNLGGVLKLSFHCLTETQFQRHAQEMAKSFDLSQFDGVVCVSGDGVLVEVCLALTLNISLDLLAECVMCLCVYVHIYCP